MWLRGRPSGHVWLVKCYRCKPRKVDHHERMLIHTGSGNPNPESSDCSGTPAERSLYSQSDPALKCGHVLFRCRDRLKLACGSNSENDCGLVKFLTASTTGTLLQ